MTLFMRQRRKRIFKVERKANAMSWNQNGVLKDSEVWGILKEMLPLGRRERNTYFQSLRQNSSRSMSLRKALFFPLCPVVFQKHWPGPLRPCPSAPGAHCQLSLKIHPALPWSQLTVARQGLGSGASKRSRKCSEGAWGFSTRRKDYCWSLVREEDGRGLLSH